MDLAQSLVCSKQLMLDNFTTIMPLWNLRGRSLGKVFGAGYLLFQICQRVSLILTI